MKDAGYKFTSDSEKQLASKTSFAAGQCSLVDGRSRYQRLYEEKSARSQTATVICRATKKNSLFGMARDHFCPDLRI